MAIRNIIFDLGGVFIDIHYHLTREAFIAAGLTDFDAYYQQSFSNPLFVALETGKIAPPDFYEQLRAQTGLALSNQTIEQAWNAMLGKFRPASIASVAPLRGRYRVYLLSNTNQIHYNCFLQAYQQQIGGNPFNGLFDTAYYSHHMGLRKPDAEAYQHILDTEGLLAAETLFIDDTPKNIAGAKAVGLQTGWLQPGMQLEDSLPLWL